MRPTKPQPKYGSTVTSRIFSRPPWEMPSDWPTATPSSAGAWLPCTVCRRLTATEVDAGGNVVFELSFTKLLFASYRAFRFEWDGGEPAADVIRHEVHKGIPYSFDTDDAKTGVSIKFNEMGGFGYNEVHVKRYNQAPLKPVFAEKAPMVLPTRIVISQFNIPSMNADISFDVAFFQFENPESILVYHREFEGRGLFLPVPTTYNYATGKIKAVINRFGECIFAYPDPVTAVFPPLAHRARGWGVRRSDRTGSSGMDAGGLCQWLLPAGGQ